MSKLKLIIEREFFAKVKNKTFIIMTFVSPLLMVAMAYLIVFLMNKNDEKIKTIAIIDEAKLFHIEDFKSKKSVKFIDFTTKGLTVAKDSIKKGAFYGTIHIPKRDNLERLAKSVSFFSEESPNVETVSDIENAIKTRLRHAKMKELNVDIQKIKASDLKTDLKLYNLSGEKSSKIASVVKMSLGSLMGYLLLMFVMIYGASVMRSVIEEKSTRIVEVIVSSVKPFQLMMGKIVGNALAGLLQFLIWGILGCTLFYLVSNLTGITPSTTTLENPAFGSGIGNSVQLPKAVTEVFKEVLKLPLLTMFIMFVFYFLGGYLLYSALYTSIGAAVENEADSQQFMTPVMVPLVLAFYVGFTSVTNDPHGPVSILFSHIPFTSPIVMMMRYPFGVELWEVILSMFTLSISFIVLVWIAAKIYRIGILSYGKKASYKDLLKWITFKG